MVPVLIPNSFFLSTFKDKRVEELSSKKTRHKNKMSSNI